MVIIFNLVSVLAILANWITKHENDSGFLTKKGMGEFVSIISVVLQG